MIKKEEVRGRHLGSLRLLEFLVIYINLQF